MDHGGCGLLVGVKNNRIVAERAKHWLQIRPGTDAALATQFEFDDIGHYGIGHGYILARPKIVDPPASCRSDIQILNELGKEFGTPNLKGISSRIRKK